MESSTRRRLARFLQHVWARANQVALAFEVVELLLSVVSAAATPARLGFELRASRLNHGVLHPCKLRSLQPTFAARRTWRPLDAVAPPESRRFSARRLGSSVSFLPHRCVIHLEAVIRRMGFQWSVMGDDLSASRLWQHKLDLFRFRLRRRHEA